MRLLVTNATECDPTSAERRVFAFTDLAQVHLGFLTQLGPGLVGVDAFTAKGEWVGYATSERHAAVLLFLTALENLGRLTMNIAYLREGEKLAHAALVNTARRDPDNPILMDLYLNWYDAKRAYDIARGVSMHVVNRGQR